MDKPELANILNQLSEQELKERLRAQKPNLITQPGLKPSAVLVPMIKREEGWCLLFTKRSMEVDSHPGEISFPGGNIESDESALGAALRETEEEIGISRNELHLLGELDEISTISGFKIHPFVAELSLPLQLKPNDSEISEVIILPLAGFLDPERFQVQNWNHNGLNYPVYFFRFPECTVWGATAKITKNLLERVLGLKPFG